MARTQFGLALDAPSKQNLLPAVAMPSGRVYGYFPIAETTFAGSETSFEVAPGVTMPLKSVTLPQHGLLSNDGRIYLDDGVQAIPKITQYMAVVYDDDDLIAADRGFYGTQNVNTSAPWRGVASFIDPKETGYASQWSNAVAGSGLRITLGSLVGGLTFSLDSAAGVQDTPPPVVNNPNATMTWFANISQSALVGECPFFDFSWITLFQASLQKAIVNGSPLGIGIQEVSQLTVASVPDGFKAYLVNRPTMNSGTANLFDTVRVMVTDEELPVGTYEFDFVIASDKGSVPVKLTLTVTVA